jgi:GLPGLI family protein
MKKTILSFSLAAFAVLSSLTTATAQVKEGSITYSITVDGLPPEQAAMAQGMEMKMMFKNGKTRAEMTSAMYSTTTVTDGKGGATTLVDMMGQKMFFKTSDADKKDKKAADPKITYVDEKKTIAGYECKKAMVENKDEKGNVTTTTVWYTEKIPLIEGGKSSAAFKGLKGAPMEFEMPQGPYKSKMTATAVSTSAISDSKFEVSTEGYTEMTPEQMMMMGGGGQ